MDRRLIILRHAKSSWKSDAKTDHDRPLNNRGRRDAPRVARELKELGWEPTLVVSSDACRTRETWGLMREVFDPDVDVVFTRDFYGAELGDVQDASLDWPDGVETVMVIGHNPGWENMAYSLSGMPIGMTTCNAVMLQGSGDSWVQALQTRWELCGVLRPRELD